MNTLLYNRPEARMYSLEAIDDDTKPKFSHTFGGTARHGGTIPPGCRKPVQLFYELDLRDQRIGFDLSGTGVTRIPFYYALRSYYGQFSYRILSDSAIELLCQPYPKGNRAEKRSYAEAMKDYPEPFELRRVRLTPRRYNAGNVEDVYFFGGLLGIDALTPREKTTLQRKLEKWHAGTFNSELAEELDDPEAPFDEIVEGFAPFPQGMPDAVCPNVTCDNHKSGKRLPVLLSTQPDESDPFYSDVLGADMGELVFQFCAKCCTMVVSNACT